MNKLVLDCSITAAWLFEDETSPYAEAVLNRLGSGVQAITASLWPLEIINVLLIGERRGRINRAQSAAFWKTLKGLPIQVDSHIHEQVFETVLMLGRGHGLSAYDAAYLELALRKAAPIASLDQALIQAATAAGALVWRC